MKIELFYHRVGAAALLLMAVVQSSFAFTSTQKRSVTAGAFVGGTPLKLFIKHTPLSSGSPVTKKAIILGEAGDEPPLTPPPYESRLTTESEFGPVEDRQIRITVRFRFVTRDQALGLDPAPDSTDLPVIEGPDPIAFAFEITPSSFVAAGNVLQYRIIADRVKLINGVLTPVSRVTAPPITSLSTESWTTVDVQANASQVFGSDGGRLILIDGNPADGETQIDIPAGLFATPTSLSIVEEPLNGASIPAGSQQLAAAAFPGGLAQPFAVYRVNIDPPLRGFLQFSLLYPDFEYPRGQDGQIDGTTIPEQKSAIVGWDGFAWRRLGGANNFKKNTLTIKSKFFNYLAIVPALPLSSEDRRPLEKTITPNGDGINDEVFFSFGDLSENIKVEIFDMSGHRVKTIMSATSLTWDGRNDSGEIVESGVYIYQYRVDGKLTSGLIAVAK